ncbi:LytR/AlgR family response regulator transcription factor [Xylocopilactobacillus apicola]|uniref:DNA-binding response regulator n=1 Tax=Xylocopilactobacillus apicola TaxID=2932184 RepID=A0AAU9DGM5_9LACO|nr:response regulator [Xylocopilactobacillus apicola]BDR59115.1 DNA-binding response regulator [Xylocopilactobacillus apicola]
MIKIFVCDDQETHLAAITKIIKDKTMFEEIAMQIEVATTNPQEIIGNLDAATTSIYFLDIDLANEQYDGLQLALKIRESDPHGFIIFITSHSEFGMLTFEYKLGAFDYIVKPTDPELLKNKIDSAIDTICERYRIDQANNHEEEIEFTSDRDRKYIRLKDLVDIEVVGNHKLKVVSKHQIFECNGSLEKFEGHFPDYFIRCRRDALVNLKEVVECSSKEGIIKLSNGFTIECSKWQIKKFAPILAKFKSSED